MTSNTDIASRETANASATYCVFRYGGRVFALPAAMLREVGGCPRFVEVPLCSRSLAGICHQHNEFLPVLRVPVRVDGSADVTRPQSKMLTVQGAHGDWGLLADEVVAIAPLDCASNSSAYGDHWSAAWLGTTTFRGEVVQVVDPVGLYRAVEEDMLRAN